jgi:ubiquinone/menaquinone biosynthesis C-methylase UbiE
MRRVLKPGGTLLSLDFNRPLNPIVGGVYLTYLTAVGSTLGFVLHRDPDTYRYIPESIRRYPGAVEVNAMIRRAGFSSSEHLPVLGGLMAIHHAKK